MQEIERKYLVDVTKWKPQSEGEQIIQAFLSNDKERIVRVRIKGNQAWLTIKGSTVGISRTELEYSIPIDDARILLEMSLDYPIEKVRFTEKHFDKTWEIDVFNGENNGLIIAEVELESEHEEIILPDWIGEEVSYDNKYFNACLSQHPFTKW